MLKIQEKILLHRAQRGDQAAFAKLYNEYAEQIRRFVIFKVSNIDKAEELTNAIFVKILNYLLKGEKIENFRALLYQTARNLIIDFYRSGSQKEVSLEEAVEREMGEKPEIAENLDLKLDLEKIERALRKIPDRYREAIVLRFVEELSFKEMAKIIAEKETNLRQLVSRGLKLLKKELTKQ